MFTKIIESSGGYAEFARQIEVERVARFEARIAELLAQGVGTGPRKPHPVESGWERGIREVRTIPREVTNHPLSPRPTREDLREFPPLVEYLARTQSSSLFEIAAGQATGRYDYENHVLNMLGDRLFAGRALRALVQKILNDHAPGENPFVVEMGCGPELLLFELAPERLQQDWHAFDSDRTNVEYAEVKIRRLPLPAHVYQNIAEFGFLLPPVRERGPADVWVGLSAYDSPLDLNAAIGAIRTKRFIHIQDVYPVLQAVHVFNKQFPEQARKWLIRGESPENTDSALGNFLDKRRDDIFFEAHGKLMDPREELHDRMLFLLAKHGYQIIEQGTFHSIYLGEREPQHEDFPDIPEAGQKANAFIRLPAGASFSYHPHIPKWHREIGWDFPVERAFLELTIAEVIVAEKAV